MPESNTPETENTAEYYSDEKPLADPDKDQLLSAATELCLMYLQCEKLIRKHEKALNPDFKSPS